MAVDIMGKANITFGLIYTILQRHLCNTIFFGFPLHDALDFMTLRDWGRRLMNQWRFFLRLQFTTSSLLPSYARCAVSGT
jgi:hypothetical protein